MRDTRAVIVGMNNPHSARPESALLPYPAGVAGHRLWAMTHEVCGVSRAEYCRMTVRVNLVDARRWDPIAARERWEALQTMLRDRRVVILGRSALAVAHLPRTTPASWQRTENFEWCYLPHPSGLCREYNEQLMRLAAGYTIEAEIERAKRDASS